MLIRKEKEGKGLTMDKKKQKMERDNKARKQRRMKNGQKKNQNMKYVNKKRERRKSQNIDKKKKTLYIYC